MVYLCVTARHYKCHASLNFNRSIPQLPSPRVLYPLHIDGCPKAPSSMPPFRPPLCCLGLQLALLLGCQSHWVFRDREPHLTDAADVGTGLFFTGCTKGGLPISRWHNLRFALAFWGCSGGSMLGWLEVAGEEVLLVKH